MPLPSQPHQLPTRPAPPPHPTQPENTPPAAESENTTTPTITIPELPPLTPPAPVTPNPTPTPSQTVPAIDKNVPIAPTFNIAEIHELADDEPDIDQDFDINHLLIAMLKHNGSDLHLSAKSPPLMRVHGDITPIPGFPILTGEKIQSLVAETMTTTQRNTFDEQWELDYAHEIAGHARFRVNVMKQRREWSVVMRTIPTEIKTVEELNLPPILLEWAKLPRGLVLVTGPTGSGKSTTLAAIIDYANRTRAGHIITIEDPIEFVHQHKRSVINQREIGVDTKDFGAALKHVLRQDPDIILVGELRDLETISIALTAAETGHLVFATLHTQSAYETISRIVDVFPANQQEQIRAQLSGTIQGIACQTLLKTADGRGRVAAVEIMTGTPGIRNQIREGKIAQIPSTIQISQKQGMLTLDQRLEQLVRNGTIHPDEALDKANSRNTLYEALGGEQGINAIRQRIEMQNTQTRKAF